MLSPVSHNFLKKFKFILLVLFIIFLEGMAKAPPIVGGPAPHFDLKNLDGQTISLSNMQGHLVVLHFWATWCVPCVKEMPEFQKTHESFKDSKIKILAINLGESKGKVKKFLQDYSLRLPILLDKFGKVAAKYKVTGLPVTYFIAPDGIVRERILGGGLTQALIDEKINQIK
jgi:peroxiredoxin